MIIAAVTEAEPSKKEPVDAELDVAVKKPTITPAEPQRADTRNYYMSFHESLLTVCVCD